MTGWVARREARLVIVAAALAVTAGYQAQRTIEIPAGSLLSALTYHDFYGDEGGIRWSRGQSRIVFPDPGPGTNWTLHLEASGWRPRGQEAPLVELEAGQVGLTVRPSPRGERLRLAVASHGFWRSDLALTLRSETLMPGPQDPRVLGVRVRTARLVPAEGGFRPRRPPLGPVVLVAAAALLVFGLLVRLGARSRPACAAGVALAIAFGWAFAYARPWAALAVRPTLVVTGLLLALAYAAPALASLASRLAVEASRAAGRGARGLGAAGAAGVVLVAAVSLALAYRARPSLEIDLGSGHEAGLARGFGPYDARDGVSFREGRRGAILDLSDAGGGAAWNVRVIAAIDGTPRQVPLAELGDLTIVRTLDASWKEFKFPASPPLGWRSGLTLELPSGARIDRVIVERGASLPSLRLLAAIAGAGLLLGVAFGALGISRAASLIAAFAAVLAAAAALAADPVASLPFALPWLGIVALGSVLAALVAGAAEIAGGFPAPWPLVAVVAASGFIGWLSATAFPLYAGGHFVFHSSIAEEIWKGRFLIYYLPFPGSMLSQQAQWGNIVVPHPCLEQTLMAPLAALPHALFYFAEKIVLASWLAGLVVIAAAVGTRLAGARAGAFAAVATVTLVPTYQLLGLGHLMTILGILASSLALAFIVFRLDRLGERRIWWTAVGLLTFCFLSYTAALLFTGVILALMVAGLWRGSRSSATALALVVLTAGALAFGLYYVNWAVPFLRESVPRILAGPGARGTEAGVPLLSRLLLQPRKWDYSYGSLLVPVLGLAGLWQAPRSRSRTLILVWACVLAAVSGVDLFFNFLLKHHYFLIVPVGVGWGVLLSQLAERGRAGRLAAYALLALGAVLGMQTAVAVALGRIP